MRSVRQDGSHPIKLQIFNNKPRKRKRLNINLYASPELYDKAKNAKKANAEVKRLRYKMEDILEGARAVADTIKPFNFDIFERRFFKLSEIDVYGMFDEKIDELQKSGKFGSVETYTSTMEAIKRFQAYRRKGNDYFAFESITTKWLKDFEHFYLNVEGKALGGFGLKMRNLRHIFKNAIEEDVVSKDVYPFGTGKGKYSIPSSGRAKRALTLQQLKALFLFETDNYYLQRAKDIFLFCYATYGMNLADMLFLEKNDYDTENGVIAYVREKTKGKRQNSTPIVVSVNDYAKSVIEKYPSDTRYLFPFIDPTLSNEKQFDHKKGFNKRINKQLKKIATEIGLPNDFSFYWCRHTFATLSITKHGKSMVFVSERLGHANLKTTENYFAGFTTDTISDFSNDLFKFD